MFTTVIHVGQPARLGVIASPLSPAVAAAERSPEQRSGSAVGPRLCGSCRRPLVAEDRGEYTPRRAALVAERGLCVCAGHVAASAERDAALPG